MCVFVTLGTIAQPEEQSIEAAAAAAEVGQAELEMSSLRQTGCLYNSYLACMLRFGVHTIILLAYQRIVFPPKS